jgi:MOSC domain-containing protein YiiM
VRLCEPCDYLQRVTREGVLDALVHRGGLRTNVVEDGTLRAGDAVSPL